MVSAERVMGYSRLEPEASLETHPDSAKPPSDWPDKGHIELKDVTYRHYPDGPLVLKGVSATILPSEKVMVIVLWPVLHSVFALSHSDWYSGSYWSRQVISDSNSVQTS